MRNDMRKIVVLLTLTLFICGCATTMSNLQRRSIESKELKGRFDEAFKATLQVFQDHGYIIKNSDYQSGVIQGETGKKLGFWGIMTNYEITATLEQFGENIVKERLSLIQKVKVELNEDSKMVDDPELFQKLYDNIQKEMFIRANLNK